MKARVAIGILATVIAFSSMSAAATTWTGAELLNDPLVAFPNGAPTTVTGAIRFGPNGFSGAKLLQIPVLAPGTTALEPIQVQVSATLTRLPCDTSANCAISAGDWDPILGLGDGVYVVGGAVGDPEFIYGAGAADPAIVVAAERDDGGPLRVLTGAGSTLFEATGFPAVGESITISLLFTLGNADTQLIASALGSEGTATFGRWIDPSRGIDFFLVQDDGGEQYQLQALTLFVVPEPSRGATSLRDRPRMWAAQAKGQTELASRKILRSRRGPPNHAFEPTVASALAIPSPHCGSATAQLGR